MAEIPWPVPSCDDPRSLTPVDALEIGIQPLLVVSATLTLRAQ